MKKLSVCVSLVACCACADARLEQVPDDPPVKPSPSANDQSGRDDPIITGDQKFTETFKQPEPQTVYEALDIWFVLDTSQSISNSAKTAIEEGIVQFLTQLPPEGHYSVGVSPAHAASENSGKLIQADEEPAVLSSRDYSPAELAQLAREKFDTIANNMSESLSDGGEAGFLSVVHGISTPELNVSRNSGFFRDDAALAIVFVADENDICSRYLSPTPFEDGFFLRDGHGREIPAYENFCVDDNLNPTMTAEIFVDIVRQFTEPNPLALSGVLYTPQSDPAKLSGENEIGYGYLEALEIANGLTVDLAEEGKIAEGLKILGEINAAQLRSLQTTFKLEKPSIVERSILVRVDGAVVSHTYNATTNSVIISKPGEANSVVEITYETREAF